MNGPFVRHELASLQSDQCAAAAALCAKKHIAQLDDFANHYSSFTQLSIGNDWRYRSELVKVQHIFKTG